MESPLKESRHGLGGAFPPASHKAKTKRKWFACGSPAKRCCYPGEQASPGLGGRAAPGHPPATPPRLIRSSSSSRDSPEPPRGGPQGTRTRRLSTHTRYGAVPAGSQSRCCSVFQEGGSGEALGKVLREDGHHRSTVPWGWCPNIDRSPFLSCLHDTLGALLSPLPSPKFLFFSRLFGTFL